MVVSKGIAFDLNAGESDVEDTFNNDKYPVKDPCAQSWIRSLSLISSDGKATFVT